jgi:hypothetical protein
MLPPSASRSAGSAGLAHPAGGVKVELEGIEPLLFGDAEETGVELESSGIVHQPVDPAAPLHHRFGDARGTGDIGEVSADRAPLLAEAGLDVVAVDAYDDGPPRGQHAGVACQMPAAAPVTITTLSSSSSCTVTSP